MIRTGVGRVGLWASLLMLGSSGCVSSLATLETGQVLKPGAIAPAVSTSVTVPVTSVWVDLAKESAALVDQAISSDEEVELTEEQTRTIMQSILLGALYAPVPVSTLGVRVGVVPRLEVGLRMNGGLGLSAKYQLLDRPENDLAVTLEYQRQSSMLQPYIGSLADVFVADSYVMQGIYSHDFRGIFQPYLALKGRYTVYSADSMVSFLADALAEYASLDMQTELSGAVWAWGGAAGFRLGWRYLYGTAELTAMHVRWDSLLVGQRTRVTGVLLSPGLGVAGYIPPWKEIKDGARKAKNKVHLPRLRRKK